MVRTPHHYFHHHSFRLKLLMLVLKSQVDYKFTTSILNHPLDTLGGNFLFPFLILTIALLICSFNIYNYNLLYCAMFCWPFVCCCLGALCQTIRIHFHVFIMMTHQTHGFVAGSSSLDQKTLSLLCFLI